jgi:hypothetical protein
MNILTPSQISVFDMAFVVSALIFNLLIMGIYITSKHELEKARRILGICVVSLGVPLAVIFIKYLLEGRPTRIILYFVSILLYIVAEILLDFVLKIDFRAKPALHIPYIVLFYFASLGFIAISFSMNDTWGYAVSVSFWCVLASLAYLLLGKKKTATQ